MLPITQALNARFTPHEAEGLHAVTTIIPIESVKAEVPLWSHFRQGMQLNGLVLKKETTPSQTATNSANLATFRVQLNLPGQAPQVVLMQLPEQIAQQQTLQLQVLGNSAQTGQTQVKWSVNQTSLQKTALSIDTEHVEDLSTLLEDANAGQAGGVASQVDLTTSAKQLNRWLSSPLFPSQTSGLQTHAVVSQHPEKAQVLAQDLKYALDHSGLFYESHLKEATLGTRRWQQLMQEPQNKAQFFAPEMVSQQLQVLEQQRVVWQGDVWPGQPMQWQVTEREAQHQSPEAPSAYFSNMKLRLPELGEVSVRITLANGRFSIRVQAEDVATLGKMQHARQQLAANLSQAGLPLDGLQIGEGVAHAAA